jgi:SnoaL-like polyketide cyclase
MTPDRHQLLDFARHYARAWCSQDPGSVARHYAEEGSLTINGGPPSVGRAAITDAAKSFMTAFPDLQVLMDDLVVRDHGAEWSRGLEPSGRALDQRFVLEHDATFGHSPDVAGEAQTCQGASVGSRQTLNLAQVCSISALCPEPAEKGEAVLEAGGHQEPPLRRQPAHEEAEGGPALHATPEITRGHAQLVTVGEQQSADSLRCHLSVRPHVANVSGECPPGRCLGGPAPQCLIGMCAAAFGGAGFAKASRTSRIPSW